MPRVFLCSATGALTTDAAPVGGGVAVLEALIPHLQDSDCELTLLTPGRDSSRDGFRQTLPVHTLSTSEPDRILKLNARGYARFALEWQAALSDYFADIDPADKSQAWARAAAEKTAKRRLRDMRGQHEQIELALDRLDALVAADEQAAR